MTEMSQADNSAFTQANSTTEQSLEGDDRVVYEIGFHIVPTISETDLENVRKSIHDKLIELGAEVISEGVPQHMKLAYRIERSISSKREKYLESYFGWLKFIATPETIPVLSKTFQETYNILRFIIVHTTRDSTPIPRRAVFISDRLEGTTIHKPAVESEEKTSISEEELDKSIEALVS